MHGVSWLMSAINTVVNIKACAHANKVCHHIILTRLCNELFDVYCAYKEAKVIWESMLTKYTADDVGNQKFMVGNYYEWEIYPNSLWLDY